MLGGRNKEKTGDAYAAAAVILRRVVWFYNAFDENIEVCNVYAMHNNIYMCFLEQMPKIFVFLANASLYSIGFFFVVLL